MIGDLRNATTGFDQKSSGAASVSGIILAINFGNGAKIVRSTYVRKFAKELKRQIPEAKICFQDESLTSVEAEKRLKGRKKTTKKGDIDSEAAAIILQDFLEEKTGKTTSRAINLNCVVWNSDTNFRIGFGDADAFCAYIKSNQFHFYSQQLVTKPSRAKAHVAMASCVSCWFSWCFWCLLAALLLSTILISSVDEIIANIQHSVTGEDGEAKDTIGAVQK